MNPFLRALCVAVSIATPACGQDTQPAEQLGRFHAACRLTVSGYAEVVVPCLSEDTPTPGFVNRWHYELGPEARALIGGLIDQPPAYVRVNGGALAEGAMFQDLEGLVRIHLKPVAPKVAGRFRELAPASEARWQWVSVKSLSEGYVDLWIEEPQSPSH